jgi:hypothetical protein
MGRMRASCAVLLMVGAGAASCLPAATEDPPITGAGGTSGGSPGAGGGHAGTGATGMAGAGAGGACAVPLSVKLEWTTGRDSTGMGMTCAQVGAISVDVLMNSARFEFPCGNNSGVLNPLAPGSYSARFLLLGAGGAVLSQAAIPSVSIPNCGMVDLGTVRFIVASGSTGAGGSGGATGAGGAGDAGGKGGSGGAGGNVGSAGTTGATGPCDAKPIFAQHSCTVDMACHDAKGSAAGFDMATAGWEKTLVGRMSRAGGASGLGSQCISSGMPFLVAGSSPARGLFLTKLGTAQQPCGNRMPLLPGYLNPAELDCVQRWANGLVSGK